METDGNEMRPFHLILPELRPGLTLPRLGPGTNAAQGPHEAQRLTLLACS